MIKFRKITHIFQRPINVYHVFSIAHLTMQIKINFRKTISILMIKFSLYIKIRCHK